LVSCLSYLLTLATCFYEAKKVALRVRIYTRRFGCQASSITIVIHHEHASVAFVA
jgi:hypothetical protein